MKVTIDTSNATWLDRYGPRIVDRAEKLTEIETRNFLDAVVKEAQSILGRTTDGTGALAQSLDASTTRRGSVISGEITELDYGRILEEGPNVDSWIIEAEYKKALRFETKAGKEVFVAKGYQIHFQWSDDMKRPHIRPAAEAHLNDFRDAIRAIPARAVKDVTGG